MADDNDQPEAGPSTSPPPSPTILPLPPLDVRWVHAGAQHLDLLPTPITALNPAYKSFSQDESIRIEERWLDMTEDDRRKAVAEWGSLEGEGAPAKNKTATKEKTKEKEAKDKSQKERSRSPKNVRSTGLRQGEVQDRLEGKMPEKEDVFSGQEQATAEEGDTRYKEIIKEMQKSYNLEKVQGVPVSQVCREIQVDLDTAYDRIQCSRCLYRPYRCIRSFGHILDSVCRCYEAHGLLVTRQDHVLGNWRKSWKRHIRRSSHGSLRTRTNWLQQ